MFDISVTKEMARAALWVSRRWEGDRLAGYNGNESNRQTGAIGEMVVAGALGAPFSVNDEADGGWDLEYLNVRVDVKAMNRKVPMRPNYVHNFVAYQEAVSTTAYVFCSFNRPSSTLTVCGWLPGDKVIERAEFFDEGATRERADGTVFTLKAPLYEVTQTALYQTDSPTCLRAQLGAFSATRLTHKHQEVAI